MGACTAVGVKSMAMVPGWGLELPPELPHPANASAASTTAVSRRTTAREGTGAGAPLLRCPAGWAWFDGDEGVRSGRGPGAVGSPERRGVTELWSHIETKPLSPP